MTVTINGTNGVTTPEVVLDNSAADGAQVVLKSSGYSDWNLDNYSGRLRGYYGSTEYWTVDASGNVGIGTSSPGEKLDVQGSSSPTIKVRNTANGIGNYSQIYLDVANSFSGTSASFVRSVSLNSGNSSTALAFGTNADGGGAPAERMRIDSSGNLLVGTTSTVGTSAAGSVHIVGGPNNNNTGPFFLRNSFATAGKYWKVGPVNDNGYIVFNQNGTGVYVADGATSWTANSDERNKDIIEPITNAAEKVCTLRSVIGKYKTDAEGTRRAFLIAQDVQAVLPEAVNAQNDERGTLGVAYTDIIPLLVAAIKEQQAIITALTARVTALEGA